MGVDQLGGHGGTSLARKGRSHNGTTHVDFIGGQEESSRKGAKAQRRKEALKN
jgi:hypothetical protein